MAREQVYKSQAAGLRASRPEPPAAGRHPPLAIYHHPVIAISLILILASGVQIGVWLVSTRLPSPTIRKPSFVTVHGLLFEMLEETISRQAGENGANRPVMFIGCLVVSLLSGLAWYGAARISVGPAWGLWTGLCWVAHPSFAFLAQRPTKLTLLIALIPIVWCLLLWWNRSRRRRTAFVLGLALGLLSLASIQGVLLLPAIILAMLFGGRGGGKRCSGAALVLAGFGLLAAPSVVLMVPRLTRSVRGAEAYNIKQTMEASLWNAFDDGDGSPVAEAAHVQCSSHPRGHRPSPLGFLGLQLRQSPRAVAVWFGQRLWRTLSATADGRLHRVLLVLQLLWLVPALWGYLVALGYPPWRWEAGTAGLFLAASWILAGFAEPLARNLTPVGGFGIIFAMVGVADVYERIFGRRLTDPSLAARARRSRPAKLAPNRHPTRLS